MWEQAMHQFQTVAENPTAGDRHGKHNRRSRRP
jgi:hypothetical protein